MNKRSNSIRLRESTLEFSEKLQSNRVKLDVDKRSIGNPQAFKLIETYFKLNNDRYLELVNMENTNA